MVSAMHAVQKRARSHGARAAPERTAIRHTTDGYFTQVIGITSCSAVLAACSSLGLSPTIDIVLSDSRLHNIITSTLNRKMY